MTANLAYATSATARDLHALAERLRARGDYLSRMRAERVDELATASVALTDFDAQAGLRELVKLALKGMDGA